MSSSYTARINKNSISMIKEVTNLKNKKKNVRLGARKYRAISELNTK